MTRQLQWRAMLIPALFYASHEEVRVDGDTMAADTDAGGVDMRIGLRVGGLNGGTDIQTVCIGKASELVGKRDIDIAVCRLDQLDKFSLIGRGHRYDARVQYRLVESDRSRQALLVDAAHHLRIGRQVAENGAGRDALRAVSKVKIAPGYQFGMGFEDARKAPGCCTHRQRRFIDHQRSRPQAAPDGFGGGTDGAEIYPVLPIYDYRYNHDHNVRLPHRLRSIDRGSQPALFYRVGNDRHQFRLLLHVGDARVDRLNHVGIDITANDAPAMPDVLDSQRQTNLAQSYDGDR